MLNEGADVNQADDMCNTALMYAAKANHPHCCNELLLREADVTMVNLNDDTAFSLAVDNGSTLGRCWCGVASFDGGFMFQRKRSSRTIY